MTLYPTLPDFVTGLGAFVGVGGYVLWQDQPGGVYGLQNTGNYQDILAIGLADLKAGLGVALYVPDVDQRKMINRFMRLSLQAICGPDAQAAYDRLALF